MADGFIRREIEERAETSHQWAIAWAIMQLADAHKENAAALRRLGLADAATPKGALEVISIDLQRLADVLEAKNFTA